jgi:two-component system cell cycle sensor histidine kinase/response regulator CckA
MRILVVDDEAVIRDLLESALTAKGHTVVVATDGVLGVHVFRHAEEPFDFVISDFQMPRMNGILMLTAIRALEPNTRMVLQSGDHGLRGLMEHSGLGDVPLLRKPWALQDLYEILDEFTAAKSKED